MRILLLAICLLALSAEASHARQNAGQLWEQALLSAKRHGTLPGPRPGQVCLWSKPLGACLWYTPSKWNLMLTDH
jgi:hypothetical protein